MGQAVDIVRQLEREKDDILTVLNMTAIDQQDLARRVIAYERFAETISFLAGNYDLPEIFAECHNHVELVQHMNETLERLNNDLSA